MNKIDNILNMIKQFRKAKLLTQSDVAQRLGVERSTYARKENGNIPFTLKEFLLIADILNISPVSFF